MQIGERHLQRRPPGGISDQSERERRHLPDIRLFVREQRRERLDRLRQPDPAERQRGAAADPRLAVIQVYGPAPDEVESTIEMTATASAPPSLPPLGAQGP